VLDPSFLQSVNVDILPDSDKVRNLGSSSLRWNQIYAKQVIIKSDSASIPSLQIEGIGAAYGILLYRSDTAGSVFQVFKNTVKQVKIGIDAGMSGSPFRIIMPSGYAKLTDTGSLHLISTDGSTVDLVLGDGSNYVGVIHFKGQVGDFVSRIVVYGGRIAVFLDANDERTDEGIYIYKNAGSFSGSQSLMSHLDANGVWHAYGFVTYSPELPSLAEVRENPDIAYNEIKKIASIPHFDESKFKITEGLKRYIIEKFKPEEGRVEEEAKRFVMEKAFAKDISKTALLNARLIVILYEKVKQLEEENKMLRDKLQKLEQELQEIKQALAG